MSLLADQQRNKRQHFAAPGGSHDRLVRLLRVALPAIVGCVLALLVFTPFNEHRELSFLLAKDAVDMAPERMRVTEALYRGEDNQGRPFSLRAGSAVQKSSKEPLLELKNMEGSMFVDGARATLLAGSGVYDLESEKMRVKGPLSFDNGKGFGLTASNVTLDMNAKNMESFGPANGYTNIGTFRADKFEADLKTRTVTLTGNAKLRINQGAVR